MTDNAVTDDATRELREVLDEAERRANALLFGPDVSREATMHLQRCVWKIEAAKEELRLVVGSSL